MATENLAHIKSGMIAGRSEYFRADGTNTPIWSPVIVAAAASGYYLPEVATTTTMGDPTVIGVSVGPLADASNGYCNIAAGELVQVCVWGICKCKVDGTDNIADGDALYAHTTAGLACLAAIDAPNTYDQTTVQLMFKYILACFAMALEAATTDDDIIPVFVYGARGTPT